MAEQIITLGIGATPDDLTPLITTGLEVGAGPETSPFIQTRLHTTISISFLLPIRLLLRLF